MNHAPGSQSAAPIIEAAGLSLTLRGQAVLSDIDFAVQPGETVALIGESGCGKTV
ncbi:MAG: ATP-binding cassette domain-containing protein, partial [Planctomycetales bacterium]|nr:ATP-binding cassette domain-containing protein [Planctomycetales bacterium]